MHIVDHVFIVLLFLVLPIYGAWSFRRYMLEVAAGAPPSRTKIYWQNMAGQWSFLGALALAWSVFERPATALGFVAPAGTGFWVGAVLLVLFNAYLVYAWQSMKRADAEEKEKHRQGLGDMVHFLPHNRRDFRNFVAVSITAGIVEEIAYRGFVLWYLALFMPLWTAVIVSSVVFGLGHSYQGATGALRCGLVGLAFAALYVITGSIWLPIIAHALLDILQGAMVFEMLRVATPVHSLDNGGLLNE